MKLKAVRSYREIGQAEFAKKVGTTAPMMSNFENYKCVPVPSMLKRMCEILNCKISDIYSDDEIYIKKEAKNLIAKRIEQKLYYKLTVRMPDYTRELLTLKNLRMCGYHSLTDFIWHCCKRFERQLAVVRKKMILSNEKEK